MHGFVLLHNHPISRETSQRAFIVAKHFFGCDETIKASIAIEKSACHRGYFGFGSEKLDPMGDNKEGLKIGRDLPNTHPLVCAGVPLHGPNQWPKGMDDFRQTMQNYFHACQKTSQHLLQALACGIGLQSNFFDAMVNEPMATLAPLHYRAANNASSGTNNLGLGAGAHTDYGCLTLVEQSGADGLEIFHTPSQSWRIINFPPDTLAMNIGDMLKRWTNNVLPSTRHRVQASGERYAFAFFFDPNYDAEIACLPNCIDSNHPASYPPIRAIDYLLERIGADFDYFALPHNTLG